MNYKPITVLYLLLLILIISCNDVSSSQQKDKELKDIVEKYEIENNYENTKDTTNKNINNDTVNEDNKNNSNENSNKSYLNADYNINNFSTWLRNYYLSLKSFSDREIQEQNLLEKSRVYKNLYDDYFNMYLDLEEIRTHFLQNIDNPPKDLPEEIYKSFKEIKEASERAMSYRIKAIDNMVIMIEEFREEEKHGKPGTTTNENLTNYQKYTQTYDDLIKKIVVAIKYNLEKLGYEMDFKTGEISILTGKE